jgi:uncharacterized circularly permuted ATP-grasp superfamily protein/uncharacterized alpha-E superfamily protein
LSTQQSIEGLYGATEDLLREHGVTHDKGLPWQLDPLPLVIEARDWEPLEHAIAQRATLLDLILADLTTEARLLSSGLLPPDIVASSPAFVRAAAGLTLPGPHQLFLTGTDLVRNADGAWTVLADRTGVPTGLGFAMEDRRVVAQVMASRYREQRVRRIGPFFRAMRRALEGLSEVDAPRIAVLTPGPGSRAAYDHAHLAAMLGVPLVEGEDLVVEDGRLWSRTLDVREPLDVLVRRVAAPMVDPLELRGDSRLGTPGLVHAIREGTLVVANTLASGLLESPALFTYLPRLARRLLGEELALPSVATYWCGDRSMCSHVIANVHRLTVRSTTTSTVIDSRELTIAQRADLCARISTEPWAWVGQEPVEPSEAPSLGPEGVSAMPTALRTFALADGDGWAVMPGAIGRVGHVEEGRSRPAKDVWVAAREPLAVSEEPEPLVPGLAPTISPRAAEDLYQLGRHLERAESLARLLRVTAQAWDDFHGRSDGSADPTGRAVLTALLTTLHGQANDGGLPDVVAGEAEGSLADAVATAHRHALAVPDLLSQDTWPAFAGIERQLARVRRNGERDGVGLGVPLGRVLTHLLALAGIMDESMVRDAGWHLLEAGRRIERASGVVATLADTHGRVHPPEVERLLIDATLTAHESVATYRRRYLRGGMTGVWELLLTDADNPRSLRFQLERMRVVFDRLRATPETASMTLADIADILAEAPLRWDEATQGGERRIAEDLESVRWRLRLLSEEITATWFARPRPNAWATDGWPA